MTESSGTNMRAHDEVRTFKSGAVRDGGKKPALELISPWALIRLGEWLRFACEDRKPKPYPRRNWEKGMTFSSAVASMERHIQQFKLGDTTEDHLAAILFNAMALVHWQEEIAAGRLPSSLDDMPHYISRDLLTPAACGDEANMRRLDRLRQRAEAESKVQKTLDKFNGDGAFAVEDIPAGAPVKIVERRMSLDVNETSIPTGEQSQTQLMLDPADPSHSDTTVYHHENGITEVSAVNATGRTVATHESVVFPHPFTVYLCGPITGQEVDYLWRDAATAMLAAHGIKTLNPLRGKKPEDVTNVGLSYKGQLAAPEIAERDRMDIEEADVVLAHFPYPPPRQSIGSLMEMGGAALGLKKPVLLCADPKIEGLDVFNDHLFCRNFCTLEPNFEQALNRLVALAHVKNR